MIAVYTLCVACSVPNYFKMMSNDFIKSLSNEKQYEDACMIVPISKTEEAIVINEAFKQIVYEQYYSKYYSDFLYALYKKESIKDLKSYLNGYDYTEVYNSVMTEYEKHGLNFIISTYLKKDISGYEFIASTQNAVLKILFVNGYYISFDDYSGKYHISK